MACVVSHESFERSDNAPPPGFCLHDNLPEHRAEPQNGAAGDL